MNALPVPFLSVSISVHPSSLCYAVTSQWFNCSLWVKWLGGKVLDPVADGSQILLQLSS